MVTDSDEVKPEDLRLNDLLQQEARGERRYDPRRDGPTAGPLDDLKETVENDVSKLEDSAPKE